MKRKSILFGLTILLSSIGVTPVNAGRFDPTQGTCWFFRDGELELTHTCTIEGASWAGGGVTFLTWEDGIRTSIAFGAQGRGEEPCSVVGVDGVCGYWGFRHPQTLEPISDYEMNERSSSGLDNVRCVELNVSEDTYNSVCWLY
jgi:hypothetical protein